MRLSPMTMAELDAQMRKSPEYIRAAKEIGPYFAVANQVLGMRLDRVWSQASLATRAGLTRNTIVAIEAALSNPTLGTLDAIADAFGLDVQIRFVEREP